VLIRALGFLLLAGAAGAHCAPLQAQASRESPKESVVTLHARGSFDVTLTPQPAGDSLRGSPLSRLSIAKQFHGDLEGTSQGEMLAAGTGVKGSAGYVALERVTGMLAGRRGSFVLQHSGTMTRGTPQLVISVVPDSGTDALTGLAGTMLINIADGKHSYAFDYTLPKGP